MKKHVITITIAILMMNLFGCAAMLIPETDDPVGKLKWANSALEMQRPLPAEKLLNEAIPLFEKENNIGMLGGVYNTYGRLDYSFPKKSDNNHSNAISNFNKSLEYLEKFFKAGGPDKKDKFYTMYHQWATNSAFCLGELYQKIGKNELSCKYFDKSFEYYKIQLEMNPDADVKAIGYKSFEESIKKNKEKSNCSKFKE